MTTTTRHNVRIGNGKAVHIADGVEIDQWTLASDEVLCGSAPVARSWAGHIAETKGETARLMIVTSYQEPTCKRCIKAAE